MDDSPLVQPDIEIDGEVSSRVAPMCPGCGLPEHRWREAGGEGYSVDGLAWCCRGCAEETGCTCV